MHGSRSSMRLVCLLVLGAVKCFTPGPSVAAQTPAPGTSQTKPAAPAKPVKEAEAKVRGPAAEDVTLTGRVVDLHSFMTGTYPNPDRAKTTADLLKAGVPAGIDTAAGLFILGMGAKNPADKLTPFAYQEVDVKGKLHSRRGARYIEIVSIGKAKAADTRGIPARPPTIVGGATTKPAAP
jgi:hypothetical protein